MVKRAALGKGLGALLADANQIQGIPSGIATPAEAGPASVTMIPLERIVPNPYQPRITFDEEALEELTESIRTLGIIQPLTLRQTDSHRYQIISGERRFRAAKAAGLTSVPAYIRKADDTAMLEMAIVENIQRENLDAIETALSFQRLIDECELTQEAMALRVGKKRATVANYLRLLKLPEEIQKAVKIGKISVGHAKALLAVEDIEKQLKLCERAIRNGWSVRQLEQHVAALSGKAKENRKEDEELPMLYYSVAEEIGRHFNNNVAVRKASKGGGSITIRFSEDSQLEGFLQTLKKG